MAFSVSHDASSMQWRQINDDDRERLMSHRAEDGEFW
jgi:hypothetical protein